MTTIAQFPNANLPLTGAELVGMEQKQGGSYVTVQAPIYQAGVTRMSQDQRNWEYQLSINGATFNGTTDDANAIQESINAIALDGAAHYVSLWPGVTAYLNSNAGSLNSPYYANRTTGAGDVVQYGCMLTIPSNLAIDGQGVTFMGGTNSSVHGGTLCSAMVLVTSNAATSQPPLSLGFFNMLGLKRIQFTSANSQNGFGTACMVIDSASQTGGCQLLEFAQLNFNQPSFHHIYSYGNAALNTYRQNYHRYPFAGAQGGTGTTGAGSCMYFATNSLGAGNNEANNVIACYFAGQPGGIGVTTEGPEVQFSMCHFDYLRQALRMVNTGANINFNHVAGMSQCHIEMAASSPHYDAAGQSYIAMTNNQYMRFNCRDPFLYVNPNVTGPNPMAYVVDSGTNGTPQVGPYYGTYLYGMGGNPNVVGASVPLYNAAANGHLVIDNVTII